MRILEVVADSLHISVSPDLTSSVEQIGGTVLADDSPAGINLANNIKHCSGFQ